MFYWVETDNKSTGCVQAANVADATKIAEELQVGKVIACNTLPYPSSPYWNEINVPDFCFSPDKCKGHSCCPRNRSCVE